MRFVLGVICHFKSPSLDDDRLQWQVTSRQW